MKEKTIVSKRKFNGRLLKLDLLEVRLRSGHLARREIVRHPGAVAALCRLPDGRFIFVKQFRKAIESDLLEVVAGTREPNEDSSSCARREVKEETGYKAAALKRLGHVYTAPGFCNERIDIFFARLGGRQSQSSPDSDEQIEPVYLTKREVLNLLAAGKIKDAKTLAAWSMYTAVSKGI